MRAKSGEAKNWGIPREIISFRISPEVAEKLRNVARLYNLSPSQFAKAVLYERLGIFHIPIDRRRKVKRAVRFRAGNLKDLKELNRLESY